MSTGEPFAASTLVPSGQSTEPRTMSPSSAPTFSAPSVTPSRTPSVTPSRTPSVTPSRTPSVAGPSAVPTTTPSVALLAPASSSFSSSSSSFSPSSMSSWPSPSPTESSSDILDYLTSGGPETIAIWTSIGVVLLFALAGLWFCVGRDRKRTEISHAYTKVSTGDPPRALNSSDTSLPN